MTDKLIQQKIVKSAAERANRLQWLQMEIWKFTEADSALELAERIDDYYSQSLLQAKQEGYTEGAAYKGKAVREAYEHGFREGVHEGYNQKMTELNPSQEQTPEEKEAGIKFEGPCIGCKPSNIRTFGPCLEHTIAHSGGEMEVKF